MKDKDWMQDLMSFFGLGDNLNRRNMKCLRCEKLFSNPRSARQHYLDTHVSGSDRQAARFGTARPWQTKRRGKPNIVGMQGGTTNKGRAWYHD